MPEDLPTISSGQQYLRAQLRGRLIMGEYHGEPCRTPEEAVRVLEEDYWLFLEGCRADIKKGKPLMTLLDELAHDGSLHGLVPILKLALCYKIPEGLPEEAPQLNA